MTGPYTEGWPKRMSQHLLEAEILAGHFTTVVPLSDAEKMRKALERRAQRVITAETERMREALKEALRDLTYITNDASTWASRANKAIHTINVALDAERGKSEEQLTREANLRGLRPRSNPERGK